MGGCRCSYRSCKSATKISGDLHFFHYPVKHKDRCEQWIKHAQKPEFFNLPDDQLRNKVVCDLHFEPRYFTNIQRKRLVHDAVPTLNIGCEEIRLNDNLISEYKELQVLPANADGTIFTVDTDSMQPRGINEPMCTYSFRNGTLVPVYTEDSDEDEHIVYTIAEGDFKNLTNFKDEGNSNYLYVDQRNEDESYDNYEIVFNGNSSRTQENRKSQNSVPMIVEVQESRRPEDTMEIVYVTEQREDTIAEPKVKKEPEVEAETSKSFAPKEISDKVGRNVSSKHVKKKFIRQIKLHSKEIASIKRTLNAGLKKSQKTNITNALRGKIPPSLLGAITLNLNKKVNNFTSGEFEFMTTLYDTSPELYKILIEKLNWSLPDPSIVQGLLKTTHNE